MDFNAPAPLDVSLRTALAGLEPKPRLPTRALLRSGSREDLEALYKSMGPGPIPDGVSDGTATNSPGTWMGWVVERLVALVWKGKIFDRENGTLINRFTFGIKAFEAEVSYGESWLDGKTSIILDYAGGSPLVGWIRDEIRMVAPGLYLGLAYARAKGGAPPRASILFTLDFNAPRAPEPETPAAPRKTADTQAP